MKQKIYVVGFGPGDGALMTKQAADVLQAVDLIVGYTTYVALLKEQFPHQNYHATPMRKEVDRCRLVAKEALQGKTVAMVSSGDSGIYGMAGVMLEVLAEMGVDLEVEIVPGLTAASTAAAVLGAFGLLNMEGLKDSIVLGELGLDGSVKPVNGILSLVMAAREFGLSRCLYSEKQNFLRVLYN